MTPRAFIIRCSLAVLPLAAPTLAPGEARPPDPRASYLGVLFAPDGVDVSAEVAGIVREVLVELGGEVAEGQVLVSLDSEDLRAEAEQAGAALATAKARASKSEAELAEVDRLLERRRAAEEIFTVEEIEAMETRRSVAAAEHEAARSTVAEREATLHELERRLAALDVRAPFAGAVTACMRDVGARVTAGQGLVRLIGSGDLWVRFAVPSGDSRWLTVGKRVLFSPERTEETDWPCEVRRISPEVDPATDMIFVEARVAADDAHGNLRAGEIGRVRHEAIPR